MPNFSIFVNSAHSNSYKLVVFCGRDVGCDRMLGQVWQSWQKNCISVTWCPEMDFIDLYGLLYWFYEGMENIIGCFLMEFSNSCFLELLNLGFPR